MDMEEANVAPEESLPVDDIQETTQEDEIEIIKAPKGARVMAHIAFWLSILGVLVCAGQFLLLMSSFAEIQRWFLSFVYAYFALGGMAIAFAVVCLILQRKSRKSGLAITGLVLGVVPFATYLILLELAGR